MHRQRSDLKSQIERGPRQIKAGEGMVASATADLDAARGKVKKAKMVSDEKQLQLAQRESRIKDLAGKLNTADSNQVFTMLKEQIAADQQANSVLSDEILEALELIDLLEADVKVAFEQLEKQKSEQAYRVNEVESKLAVLNEDLTRVESELHASEQEIPEAAKPDYKRLTEARGEDALAPVEDDSCGGCYQTLTMQHIETLRMSMLMRCPNCNAFLYFPENLRP